MAGKLVHSQPRVVYVGSKNPVKVAAVTQALKSAFPGQRLSIQAVPSSSGVPDQPFGEEETKQGAVNRIVHIRRRLQLPSGVLRGGHPPTASSPAPYLGQQQEQQVAPSTTQPAAHQGNPLQQQHQQQLLLVEEEVLLVAVEGGVMWRSSDDLTCFAWAALQRVTPDTAADSHAARVSLARSAEFLLPPAVARLVAGGMELGQADDQVFGRVRSGQGTGTVGHLTHGLITRQTYYEHAVALALIPYLHPSALYPEH